ncbi:MAG: DnaJ domain-containing protein [Parasporobacterium sp.]|nr:DnaJ domain-containing protein [Parasporobacterium sp.]
MTIQEARRILSVAETADRNSVKKKYRQLMHLVHPDALGEKEPDYEFGAHEINAAYEFLIRFGTFPEADAEGSAENAGGPGTFGRSDTTGGTGAFSRSDNVGRPGASGTSDTFGRSQAAARWKAPVNQQAFTEREIFLDHLCVATGKYYLTGDEEFRMFLLSIYRCSRKILESFSDAVIRKYQGEAAYLLSQQFIDRKSVLDRYEISGEAGGTIYYFPAMLETEGRRCQLAEGAVLYPGSVRNHRLYLNSRTGRELGYLSFDDDRIYYALVPLFEQRRVQVKIRVAGSTLGNNNKRAVKVRTVDLWVRMAEQEFSNVALTISGQIEALLDKCRAEDSGGMH